MCACCFVCFVFGSVYDHKLKLIKMMIWWCDWIGWDWLVTLFILCHGWRSMAKYWIILYEYELNDQIMIEFMWWGPMANSYDDVNIDWIIKLWCWNYRWKPMTNLSANGMNLNWIIQLSFRRRSLCFAGFRRQTDGSGRQWRGPPGGHIWILLTTCRTP